MGKYLNFLLPKHKIYSKVNYSNEKNIIVRMLRKLINKLSILLLLLILAN